MADRLTLDVFEAAWGADLDDVDRSLLEFDGPALCNRQHAIPELAARLVERSKAETGRQIDGLSPAATEAMMKHHWGGPEELERVVMHAVEDCQGSTIESDDLDLSGFPG